MTKEELKAEATEFEENYTVYEVAKRKDGTDYAKKVCKVTVKEAYLAGAEPREKRIAELELKIKLLTKHLKPQAMTALFRQVEEEIKQEQRIKALTLQLEKMKADVELARDNANKAENWETFSVLKSILDDWERKEND